MNKLKLLDSLIYVRETEANPNVFDTLKAGHPPNCFPGFPGKHRVLVYSGDSLVYGTDWIQVDAKDCCNTVDDKFIDLPL
ncbi:MAG: hypothetical protein JWO30_1213 [Fibrobacteres bacterium]|nr:hypothetical protein [Fibrobacterota bacterium]